MNFGTIILDQSMETEQNFVTQILTPKMTEDFFEDISNDVEKWFDTSNYNKKDKIPLLIGKNKKVPGLFKDKLGGKIITEFVALRPKAYSYLDDDGNEHKKSKDTKRCVTKQKLMFQNFKDCLFNNKTVHRSQERFKSHHHQVYTEEVNKIALSGNDDKRLRTSDRITRYLYGTNAFKVCESEMLMVKDLVFEMVLQQQ